MSDRALLLELLDFIEESLQSSEDIKISFLTIQEKAKEIRTRMADSQKDLESPSKNLIFVTKDGCCESCSKPASVEELRKNWHIYKKNYCERCINQILQSGGMMQ